MSSDYRTNKTGCAVKKSWTFTTLCIHCVTTKTVAKNEGKSWVKDCSVSTLQQSNVSEELLHWNEQIFIWRSRSSNFQWEHFPKLWGTSFLVSFPPSTWSSLFLRRCGMGFHTCTYNKLVIQGIKLKIYIFQQQQFLSKIINIVFIL